MRFEKSTKILINFVLILVIALLVNSLITVPSELYARKESSAQQNKYKMMEDAKKRLAGLME